MKLLHTPLSAVTTALICAVHLNASAQDKPNAVNAGLWQYNTQIKSQSGQVEMALAQARKKLADLPDSERKSIEKIMAEKGVNLEANGTTLKVCLSAQDAAAGVIPLQKGDCNQKTQSTQGNRSKVAFSCKTDPAVNGTGDIDILSPTTFTSQAVIETQVNGKSERLNVTQEGKWLSAECGAIAAAN
jgi:hypothetical protein